MTPEELEQAMHQFEAQGGKVDVVAGFEGVAAYRGHIPEKPKEIFKRPPREVSPAVLETIRGFVDIGICAAAKALRKKPETIKKIAMQHGIKFTTTTMETNAERWTERKKMVPDIVRLIAAGYSQEDTCKKLGITRWVLRGTAEKYGLNIDSRSGSKNF